MNFAHLLKNEARLHLITTRAYWFETVTTMVMVSLAFLALFYGIQSVYDKPGEMPSLDGLLFGYIIWFFSIAAFTSSSQSMIVANQTGVISQLFLCPLGLVKLILARVVVIIAWNLLMITALAYIAMAVTGNWLDFDFGVFYLLLLAAAPSLIGIGMMVTGLALLFKRVQTVSGIMLMGCMGLVVVDATPFNGFSLLPFAMGASLARDRILEGAPLDLPTLAMVLLNSTVYLFLGIVVYKAFEKRAKRLNVIGHY